MGQSETRMARLSRRGFANRSNLSSLSTVKFSELC